MAFLRFAVADHVGLSGEDEDLDAFWVVIPFHWFLRESDVGGQSDAEQGEAGDGVFVGVHAGGLIC